MKHFKKHNQKNISDLPSKQKIQGHSSLFIFHFSLFILLFLPACQHPIQTPSKGDEFYTQAEEMAGKGDYEKTYQLLRKTFASYQDVDDKEGMASAWIAMAQIKTEDYQSDSALYYVDQALTLQVSDSMYAALLNEKGAIFAIMGEMKQAVRYIRQAIELGDKAFYGEDKAVACGNAAVAYRRLGMPDSACYFLEEGIQAAQEVNDDEDLAYLYNNLSTSLSTLGRQEEALDACQKAYEAAIRADDITEKLNSLSNKAFILMKKGEVKKSTQLIENILPQIDSIQHYALELKTLSYLLQAYLEQDDTQKINYYLNLSEELVKQVPTNSINAVGLLETMANIKLKNGDYVGAFSTLEQVDSTALSNGTYPRDIYLKQKAICAAGLGNYRQAYNLSIEAAAISDTLRGENVQRQLSELSEQLKAQERETEIARLNKTVARRQLYIVLFAMSFIILALLTGIYIYLRRRREAQAQAHKYVEGLEKERARFARELHDGACNELLGIGMAISTQMTNPEEVASRISQLRDTLRNISHELMPPQFDSATLDEILHYYLQHIQSPTLSIHFSSQGDFSTLPKHIAYELYRITQEAVGNIISHASATIAQVDVNCNSKEVNLIISDNGQNTSSLNTHAPSGGIGLQSIHDRAKSIDATLNISHDNQGTKITIHKHISSKMNKEI